MKGRNIAFVAAVVLGLVAMSTYTIDQRQTGVLLRLGKIETAGMDPGLHFKFPLINNVRKFDARVLHLDSQPERFLTSEKKNVIVDFFVKWQIDDVLQYYRATLGDELRARSRLSQIIKDGLRNEFGKRTIREAVSGERSDIMGSQLAKSNALVRDLGIKIIDVRVSRIDLPDEVSTSVYERMRAERDRVAKDFRARGMEAAERLRAAADKERTVILANAYRDAQLVRGDGDAKSTETYANAYEQNPEFFDFTRSLKAYQESFGSKGDVLILEPDSDFFQYFNDAGRAAQP